VSELHSGGEIHAVSIRAGRRYEPYGSRTAPTRGCLLDKTAEPECPQS
jgi:hypothetical protein